ncbi:hypothetical protein Rsub_06652 [Raphidocelis subcapitata]|uniref:Ubiquitin-like domain-containing protein n=1 Tax=Raphidocelis subcapitata TaxID=307507 RepID=A0A2V0P1S4_9CHLO|nr:hypothetical protein Rsub_06652 [Raphidocelis subcapitata]|eukprot:GBF93519.1 hypothetical protein Rsub_06652 [Raphidocelis subcapitata]
MAAYGGHEAVEGNQITVSLRSAKQPWPPVTASVRVKYEETVADIKRAVERALGVPPDSQQLFWHKRELTAAFDSKTLSEMHMHTGAGLKGYDTRHGPPKYNPPVKPGAHGGLEEDC